MITIFEKDMKFPLLLDTYGVLLSDRKREILEYYYNEDYSLAEISELTGISRQGVRDSIQKSKEEIYEMEAKLQVVAKNERLTSLLEAAADELEALSLHAEAESKDRLSTLRHSLLQIMDAFHANEVQE